MSDPTKTILRAAVIELDFTALDGAEILFSVAKQVFAEHGVELTVKLEALHLAGGSYQGAIAELYEKLGKKGDAAKLAKELDEAFRAALSEKAAAAAAEPKFQEFVKALVAAGLKVVVDTRAAVEPVAAALAALGDGVVVYAEPALTYGSLKWDGWRRACKANEIAEPLAVAVTGSGYGVRAAMVAGMAVVAKPCAHTEYQDFGGADAFVDALDASAAATVLSALHLA